MSSLYEKLPIQSDDIRLLTILRGERNSPLACSLAVTPLGDFSRHLEGVYSWRDGTLWDSNWDPEASRGAKVQWVPRYEALSYMWGDAARKRPLKVNQFEESVTVNLYSGLLALRLIDQDRALWVDALCINQNDIEERNNQVQRMQSIYQRATKTLVWLGEADDTSDRALKLLESLGGTREQIRDFNAPPTADFAGPQFDPVYGLGDAEADFINIFKSYIKTLNLMGIADLNEDDWVALDRLFGRPYWKRMWIVQEITNAQVVEVYCGSNSISWQTINCIEYSKQVSHEIQQLPLDTVKRYTELFGRGAIGRIINQRNITRHWVRSEGFEHNQTTFLNLLERFRDFNCTDPRDKVYALLGLASIDKNMPLPKPDYSKSVRDVYCTTARAIIEYTRDLTILCLPKTYNGRLEYGLTCWCPDWTTQTAEIPLLRDDPQWPSFNAAGETLPQGPGFNFEQDGQPLTKRRPRQSGRSLWVIVECEPNSIPSTIRHPEIDVRSLHDADAALILKGYIIDRIMFLGKSIPENSFSNGEWKKVVVEWEALLDKIVIFGYDGDNRNSPEMQEVKLKSFIATLCRGAMLQRHTWNARESIDMNHELYLIWTGRMLPSEAKNPESGDPRTQAVFELELLQYLKRWKMALGWDGRLMLVPEDATERDCIAILFGADVPMLLRPSFIVVGSEQRYYQHIGTVYAIDLMWGEALHLAQMKGLEQEDFGLI